MRKKLIMTAAIIMASAPVGAFAQTGMETAVNTIVANNATLKAMRHETEAAKAEAHATNSMPDPEVSFGYLWSGRKDVSVSQPLDWATMTGRRRAAAAAADTLAEATYAAAVRETTLRARTAYIGAVRGNALTRLLAGKAERAGRMALMARKRLAAGSGRQTDVASAAAAKARAIAELAKAQAELDMRMAELRTLNGGQGIEVADTSFGGGLTVYGDFATWLANEGGRLAGEDVSRAALGQAQATARVEQTEAMPQVAVGFMGEFTEAEKYKGVTVGVSVPLWSAGKRKRQTELTLRAAEQRATAAAANARAEAEALFNKTVALGRVAAELREALEGIDGRELTAKAVEQGEMTAAEALMAEEMFYSACAEAIEAEAEYQTAAAELYALLAR